MLSPALAPASRVLHFPYSRAFSPRNTMPLLSSIASATLPAPCTIQNPNPIWNLNLIPKPWLLVGLGNPGWMFQKIPPRRLLLIFWKYSFQVGFKMIDAIARAEGISMSSIQFKALLGNGLIANVPVMLAKPQTFMNASGECVGSLVSHCNIPLNQVLLMYDDMDLPFATLRLLPKGGHGGHYGMRSVIDQFKRSREFLRLRIGIGRPPGTMNPIGSVLPSFNRQEREALDFTFMIGVQAVRIRLLEGFDKSATFVNSARSLKLGN